MLGTAILAKSMVMDKLTESGGVGHTEVAKKVILPKTSVTAVIEDPENPVAFTEINTKNYETLFQLWQNKNTAVTVMYDGNPYACDIIAMDSALCIGNLKYFDGEDTGEPFIYVATLENPDTVVCETAGEHTIAIYQETETIHPIDPKYIPWNSAPGGGGGGGLPVVELSEETISTWMENGTAIANAEETAAFIAAENACMPIVGVGEFGNYKIAAIGNLTKIGNYSTYYFKTTEFTFKAVISDDGVVAIMSEEAANV